MNEYECICCDKHIDHFGLCPDCLEKKAFILNNWLDLTDL